MTTKEPTQSLATGLRAALALLLAGLLAAVAATSVSAKTTRSAASQATLAVSSIHVVSTIISTHRRTWTYDWPVKPFDSQHPVRAYLNDPRIGAHGSTAFHFGIDVSAPDGTPVYAVEAGTVFFDSPRAIAVVEPGGGRAFGYWHIVPAVRSHQFVARHQLIGYVEKGWEHVHFAERLHGAYVNPLRDGGLGPFVDHTAPTVSWVGFLGSDLVAVASDTTLPRVPGAWGGLPVTPALIRVEVGGGPWQTAVDLRNEMLPRSDYSKVYTPATRQNHEGEPGTYSFYLVRGLAGRLGPQGAIVHIETSDMSGNATVESVRVGGQV
jgi:hypothetical protein